jgi:hypothetical protein
MRLVHARNCKLIETAMRSATRILSSAKIRWSLISLSRQRSAYKSKLRVCRHLTEVTAPAVCRLAVVDGIGLEVRRRETLQLAERAVRRMAACPFSSTLTVTALAFLAMRTTTAPEAG